MEDIAAAAGEDVAHFREVLERVCYLGFCSYYTGEDGRRLYKKCIWVPGISEHIMLIPEHQTPEIAALWHAHTMQMSSRGSVAGPGQALLRVLPINESIDAEAQVADWETIQNYLDQSDLYSAAPCECRLANKISGTGCEHPIEDMCIQIGPEAEYYIQSGRGHRMTRQQVEAQLRKAEEAGLVHEVFVSMGKDAKGRNISTFICNCCGCSCISLRASRLFNNSDGSRSNYVARVDPKKCVGCGNCVENCNANAVLLGSGLYKENQVPDYEKPYDTEWGPEKWNLNYREMKYVNSYGTAPCKTECPAHISVQGYIRKAHEGKFDEALKVIKRDNPFPAICGRVCPHDCERECSRRNVDEAIAIDDIKKYIADRELQEEHRYIPEIKERRQGRIAVIGGGPAGLSCAYYAALDGFDVTVFEKENVLGGMMTLGIPSFRLEKGVIHAEIDVLRRLGVKFQTGVEVGRDVTIPQLRSAGYQAFYIATGLQSGGNLAVAGGECEGVISGVDFMRGINTGRDTHLTGSVVVIGGGNVACDVARTALRCGAETVDLYCLEGDDAMPCGTEDKAEVLAEGIRIHNGWGPAEVLTEEDRVCGVRFRKCTALYDAEGRFAPQYDEAVNETQPCTAVLFAIGQKAVWGDLLSGTAVRLRDTGTVEADPISYQTAEPDIFVGGDACLGPKLVITAIASGKSGAISLRRYLQGLNLTQSREREYHALDQSTVDFGSYDKAPRQRARTADSEAARRSFHDLRTDLTEEQIMRETARCLGCGISVVDEFRCFGCGVCASRCEFDAIKLVKKHDVAPVESPQDWAARIRDYQAERAKRIAAKRV